MKRLLLIGVLLSLCLLVAIPAQAQTPGYPGTTTTQKPKKEKRVRDDRRPMSAGDSRTIEDCGFLAGSQAAVSFNGAQAGSTTAGADGCHRVAVQVLGEEFSRGSCPRVRVNGVEFVPNAGTNAVVLDGTGSNSAPLESQTNIVINCDKPGERARGGDLLPSTGSSLIPWVGLGLSLLLIGGVAVLFERRRLSRRTSA